MVSEYLYKDHTDLPEHRVKALQYTGEKENLAEVLRFVPVGKIALMPGLISIRTPWDWKPGHIGDYIVHSTDGEFYIFTDEVFNGYYKLA